MVTFEAKQGEKSEEEKKSLFKRKGKKKTAKMYIVTLEH